MEFIAKKLVNDTVSLMVRDGNTVIEQSYSSNATDEKDLIAEELLKSSKVMAKRLEHQDTVWLEMIAEHLDSADIEVLRTLINARI